MKFLHLAADRQLIDYRSVISWILSDLHGAALPVLVLVHQLLDEVRREGDEEGLWMIRYSDYSVFEKNENSPHENKSKPLENYLYDLKTFSS
jgi:hypothetical protein